MVLVAVLRQQFETLGSLLLAGDEFAKPTRGLLELHLGKVKDGLQGEGFGHGLISASRGASGDSSRPNISSAEERGQGIHAFPAVGPFSDVLLQETLHLRIERDGLIEQRVGAGRIGADGEQVAGALVACI